MSYLKYNRTIYACDKKLKAQTVAGMNIQQIALCSRRCCSCPCLLEFQPPLLTDAVTTIPNDSACIRLPWDGENFRI